MKITRIASMALLVFSIAGPALAQERTVIPAQERNQYLVSIKAGAVNMVEGNVTFRREGGEWDPLIAGESLSDGYGVKTGSDGRAEILLNPGSFLRLSENTEIIFVDTSLDRLKVRLVSGSAYVEAAVGDQEPSLPVTIVTPQSDLYIMKGGLYRFNVAEGQRSEALVRRGRLMMPARSSLPAGKQNWVSIPRGPSNKVIRAIAISEGKKVIIEGDEQSVLAFNKKDEDEFDLWSKDRAKTLIAANKKLARNKSLGLISSSAWVFNPFFGSYCFLPRYNGFSSPYGGRYSACNNPWRNRGNGYPGDRGYNGGGSGSGSGSGSGAGSGGGSGSGGGVGSGSGSGSRAGSSGASTGGARGGGMGAAPTAPRGSNRRPR